MHQHSSTRDVDLSEPSQTTASHNPEDPDLTMSSDDAAQIYMPPPHLVARFYRPAYNRRKSSAASSRRNSISSAHSHHSNRSYHGGPQSSHIAQHLRRASILETRKARLADRAAHAEKVRLRAAITKAAPRPSNCEERSLAAQQAREKYLAQVTASCAEEVKRAKKIAEDMKEKKAAEERKLRDEMEDKFAEAEKRRFEYKKNGKKGRVTSMPVVEEKRITPNTLEVVSEQTAAKQIQSAWRARQRRRAVNEFLALGLTIEGIRNTSFDDVGALLSQDTVLKSTAKVLRLYGIQDVDGDAIAEGTAIRTFLSAFLILSHPAEVLSSDGEQEQDLIFKSRDLLVSFERLLSLSYPANSFMPPTVQLESTLEAYSTFVTAFSAWKAHDSSTLVQTMLAQFVELDQIWQTVKGDTDGNVADDYREGIRDNQIMLLVRIKKLAGRENADKMIHDAIRKARRARNRRRPVGDVRPRAAVAKPSPPGLSSSSLAAEITQPESLMSPQVHNNQLQDSPATRRTLESDKLIKVMSPLPDNRFLIHELAINKEYRIETASTQAEMRETVHRAIFDAMRNDIQAGKGDDWVVAMAETIRGRLLRLLTPGNSMHVTISEALDLDVIRNQCSRGGFSYEKFFSFMLHILPKLCAPFRDPDIKALAEDESGDVIDRLARLMHVIDLLSLDFANFLLQDSAPGLIAEAAGYEQRQFTHDLESNTINLQKTQRWWSHARKKAFAEANRRDPQGSNLPANRPSAEKIYMQGLTDLAISTTPLQEINTPETLQLDQDRITRICSHALKIVTIGSILLTAKNMLKRDVRSQWKVEATRIWDALKDGEYIKPNDTTAMQIQSILESSHAIPPATKTQLVSTINRVLYQAQSGQLTDAVMKLLFQRLKSHILTRLSATSAGDRVRAASTASEGLASSGLPEFVGQIGGIVEELIRVADVDRKAHGIWYEKIAEQAATDAAATS
ncbi:MAG: hypothetical protein M1827_002939 [Pycnora praestabilis]|nr:MAG: hypothetical protein M1827_002939 [Pycnora praestabilis]